MPETLLKVNDIVKAFGGLVAVNHFSFEVCSGTIHSLIGPNGSGKTTAINLISGLLRPDSGSIQFCGEELQALAPYKIARKGISRTYQNLKLFESMSVLENVMIGGQAQEGQGILRFLCDVRRAKSEERALREKAEGLLDYIGMYHLRDENVKNLPYGRQKMVEIGRALMSNPRLLLLDEPAAGLNPSERTTLVEMLRRIADNGIQLLLIEHNMDVVMSLSDKITVLSFGNKIAEGSPADIQNDEGVIQAYLGSRYKKEGA